MSEIAFKVLSEELDKSKIYTINLYFKKEKEIPDEWGKTKIKRYSPKIEELLKGHEDASIEEGSLFEAFDRVVIQSTNPNKLIKKANSLYNLLEENDIPLHEKAGIVFDPNGIFFDLAYGHKEKEKDIFKRALGGTSSVIIYGKNYFVVDVPIEKGAIKNIIKALEEVRSYMVKKTEIPITEYFAGQ